MALYDINGNEIPSSSASVSEALVRQAIVNGVISGEIVLPSTPASGTLSLGGLATNWIESVRTSFDAMMADYKSDAVDGIPLFLATDLHGISYELARIPHNFDSRVFSAILGDLCGDVFNNGQIANIKAALKPVANIVSVAGNHDVFVRASDADMPSYYAVNDAFRCTNAKHPDNKLCQTVYDNLHGAKYLAISPYQIQETKNDTLKKSIGTAEMTWLLNELSADDGYDIVVFSHEPFDSSWVSRDGETRTDAGYGFYSGVRSVLAARKAVGAGTVVDADGVEHSYDFTKLKTKCLCSFHGHLHQELYSQKDGWTEYLETKYTISMADTVSWALIDRNAMTLTIYKAGQDNLVLNL